jgi:hypothetical protein
LGKDELQLPDWDDAPLTAERAFEAMSLAPGCGLETVNRRYVLIAGANFPGLVFRDGADGPPESRKVRLLMEAYRLVRDAEVRRTSAALPALRPPTTGGHDPTVEVELGTSGLPTITPRALNAYASGQALLTAGAPVRALAAFGLACELYPGNPLFELMHNWAQYVAGRITAREVEIHIERTLHRLPEFLEDLRAQCWVMLARVSLDKRDYAAARQRYRSALEFSPRHPEAAAGAVARPETPSPSGPGRRPHTESLP